MHSRMGDQSDQTEETVRPGITRNLCEWGMWGGDRGELTSCWGGRQGTDHGESRSADTLRRAQTGKGMSEPESPQPPENTRKNALLRGHPGFQGVKTSASGSTGKDGWIRGKPEGREPS